MTDFKLQRSVVVPQQRNEVFAFFSDAFNLQVLTPAWLRFQIETPPPIEMAAGTRIDYRLSLRGIPMRWTSEITAWQPPFRFVDEQVSGPYRKWIHEHRFEEHADGTLVHDDVTYAVLGDALVNKLFVIPQLKKIFDYRRDRMTEFFSAG